MPYTLKDPVRHKFPKPSYNKRTWAEYDKGLRALGYITIWFSEDAASSWNYVRPEKMKRGRQCKYSDFAIEAAHTGFVRQGTFFLVNAVLKFFSQAVTPEPKVFQDLRPC